MNSQLLKANEVAERLNISRSQAFTLMRNGDLPTVRFGRLVRVRPEDLESFIVQNLSSNPEIDLKTKLAAATASVENNSANHPTKGDHHE
jgi:excisionase family DNA binding protein